MPSHSARAGIAVGSLAIVLAGCGQATMRQHAAEQTVSDFVFRHTEFRPTDMRCPSGVPAKVGRTFQCHFTGPDARYVALIRITGVHGQRVEQYITTHPVEGTIGRPTINVAATERTVQAFVFRRSGFRATDVRCAPPGIPAKVGATLTCRFTGPDGHYGAIVRIASVNGQSTTDDIVTRKLGP
jgi:Domain of unknown function (DUF4333)